MKIEDNELEHSYDSVTYSVGATVVLSLILFLSWVTEFLPDGVLISIGLFFSLPLIFSFIFGIIYNKPDFSVRRRYGFLAYWVVALGFFYYFMTPDSVTGSFVLFSQFLAGFLICMVSGLLYVIPYKLMKKQTYRVKASLSFCISFSMTVILLFTLKYFNVFQTIS